MPVDHSNTFDPTLRDNGIPQNAPSNPVGALDELESLGLDAAIYPACAKPNKALGVRGCQAFGSCVVSCKGKPESQGGGPRHYAWERLFKGQKVRRMEGTCWDLAKDAEFVEDNGGAIRIVAEEGQSYSKLVGVAVKTFVDAEGNVQKVVAKEGEYHLPNVQREDKVIDIVVRPFVRPHENPDIATDVITAGVVRKEHERIQSEAIPRALGIEGAGEPLDKRNKRTGKGQG